MSHESAGFEKRIRSIKGNDDVAPSSCEGGDSVGGSSLQRQRVSDHCVKVRFAFNMLSKLTTFLDTLWP